MNPFGGQDFSGGFALNDEEFGDFGGFYVILVDWVTLGGWGGGIAPRPKPAGDRHGPPAQRSSPCI